VAPVKPPLRSVIRSREEVERLVFDAGWTAAALVIAAAAMDGVTLSARGFLVALAVIAGGGWLVYIGCLFLLWQSLRRRRRAYRRL
jgi:hypothetical protein